MSRAGAAAVLLVRFAWQVVWSGLTTGWLIVRPGRKPEPALVRMRYAPMSDAGAALLGCMITLTPGSTTIDVDTGRRELLLHLLDGRDPQAAVDGIRREFEPYVLRLFGAAPAR